jgi:hypothetical protein
MSAGPAAPALLKGNVVLRYFTIFTGIAAALACILGIGMLAVSAIRVLEAVPTEAVLLVMSGLK